MRERIGPPAAIGGIPADHLARLTTGIVADALRMGGLNGAVTGVLPVTGFEDFKVVGPAVTVAYGPVRPDSPRASLYEAIRGSTAGSVLVIDGKGLPCNFAGDNMGECAKRQGLLAVIVYGGARDLSGYRAMDMPLYCTGPSVASRPSNFEVVAWGDPLELGGVLVRAQDVIVADADGVVVIPREALLRVAEHVAVVLEAEADLQRSIRSGAPLEAIAAALGKKRPRA